ncbi:MAG: glycine oxidase ThiO [Hydrogenothermaceae bacterium]
MKGIIVGGGIIGLSLARAFHKLGYEIVLIEKGFLGRGASWAAGGMLAPQAEGLSGVMLELCLQSREMYKSFVKEIELDTGDDVGFWECGIVYPAFSPEDQEILKKRIYYYNKLGLKANWYTREDFENAGYILGNQIIGGAFFPDDKQVDNRLLVNALIKYVKSSGITVMERTTAIRVNTDKKKFKSVITDKGEISGDFCIIAAGAWSSEIYDTKVFPIKGQMLSFKQQRGELDKIFYSKKAYIIPRKNSNIIVVGATEENVSFKPENTVGGIFVLLKGLLETFPRFKDKEFLDKWYGFRPATPDGMPIIGKTDIENLYMATGHYRNGILLTPITTKILVDLIHRDEKSHFLDVFNFFRFQQL